MTAAMLNIAALSQRTGVAPDTMRKWEQRYGVLRPVRTAGGSGATARWTCSGWSGCATESATAGGSARRLA